MKTDKFIPSLSREEGATILTLQLRVADKEDHKEFFKVCIRPEDVLVAYKQVIVASVKARMDACVRNLAAHQNNIVEANEHHVTYINESGRARGFVIPSFRAMEDVVKAFENNDLDAMFLAPTASCNELMRRAHMADQILKSLYFYPERPNVDQYNFSDLISILFDILHQSISESQKLK